MRRRDLAVVLLAGARAASGQAPVRTTAEEDLAAARERVKANRGQLDTFKLPMATEPAFAFQA